MERAWYCCLGGGFRSWGFLLLLLVIFVDEGKRTRGRGFEGPLGLRKEEMELWVFFLFSFPLPFFLIEILFDDKLGLWGIN